MMSNIRFDFKASKQAKIKKNDYVTANTITMNIINYKYKVNISGKQQLDTVIYMFNHSVRVAVKRLTLILRGIFVWYTYSYVGVPPTNPKSPGLYR